MSARCCSVCQKPGHYAPRCPENPRRDACEAPLHPRPFTDTAPKGTASARAPRSRPDDDAREARAYPFEHTQREGDGLARDTAFRWRHTWTHAATGERIVATVPLPASGDPYADFEGAIVRRRYRDAFDVKRDLLTAHVELFAGDGAYVGHIAVVEPDPHSDHEGLF